MFEFPEIPSKAEVEAPSPGLDDGLAVDPELDRKLYQEPLKEIQSHGVGGPCAEAVAKILGIEDPKEFQKIVAALIAASFEMRGHSLTEAVEFAETPGGVTSMLDMAIIMFVAGMQHERNGGGDND